MLSHHGAAVPTQTLLSEVLRLQRAILSDISLGQMHGEYFNTVDWSHYHVYPYES